MGKTLRLTADVDPPTSELTLGHYAILGVLRARPTHGYEIAQRFGDNTDLSLVLPLDRNSVYTLLKDLDSQGLIQGRREVIGLRPVRTVFSLTSDARTRFLAWATEPVERLRELRSAFLLKLYFCRELGAEPSARLLDAQVQTTRAYLEDVSQLMRASQLGSFTQSVYSSKLGAAEAALSWLLEESAHLSEVISVS
jgi:DNA-binding PadR family transcriptional regulator